MLQISVKGYTDRLSDSMAGLDAGLFEIYKHLVEAKVSGARVLIMGNGGSLAIAQHFAQDLLKLCSVRAWVINCPSMITAHSNDDGFELSFFNQAVKMLDEDDLIFIFSCSGKSRNYASFVDGSLKTKNTVISVVGVDGGFLKIQSNLSLHVKSNDYQICETAFCVIADVLVKSLLEGHHAND